MKKCQIPIVLLFIGIVLCLLTFNGVMQIEKLNFLIEPYFIFFMLGLFSLGMSVVSFLFILLAEFINFLKRK